MKPASTRPTTKIITGQYKGRVLQLPAMEAARPTRNRVLQAAFNILQGYTDFNNLTVAELCCGSGAWGLEALSRGAVQVYLVDTTPRIAKQNVQALEVAAQAQVIQADAASWAPSEPVDLVLADPPYGETALLAAILHNHAKLGQEGTLWLLETAAEVTVPWPSNFTVLVSRTYGVSALHLARQKRINLVGDERVELPTLSV
jgi:16S rRNA (guanine966-N2)-methyltransferase